MNRKPAAEPNRLDWWSERRRVWRNLEFEIPLMIVLVAVSIGIGLAQWLALPIQFSLLAALIAMVGAGVAYQYRRWRWSRYCVLILLASLAAWRHSHQMADVDSDELRLRASESWSPVVFEGRLDAVPRWRPNLMQFNRAVVADADPNSMDWQTILEVEVTAVRDGLEWVPTHGRLTVSADSRLRQYLPGDLLRFYAKWERIGEPTNPGQFDMEQFYRMKGQFARARTDSADQIQKIGVVQRWRLDRWLGMLVRSGDEAIHRYVTKNQAALASALVLGQREQVEWDVQESMLATGTMHLLAISGLNVEMVAISVVAIASFLRFPRRFILLLSAVTVICYAVLSGGQPPVVRAAVLVVTVCIGRWIGRSSPSLNLLALAGLLLLAFRTIILFDIGTQLSFLAVACISIQSQHDARDPVPSNPLGKVIYASRPHWQQMTIDLGNNCWNMLRTSVWVWLITAPLILYTFHVVSPIAILLNVALWLPILGALLSGLGLLVFGPWLPPAGMVFGAICSGCVVAVQWIVAIAQRIPASHAWLPAPSFSWMIGFYVLVIFVWAVIGFVRTRRRLTLVLLGSWLLLGIAPLWFGPRGKWPLLPSGEAQPLRITFIDVGHGTCVLIQTPQDHSWLYDAGRMGDADRSFMGIASVLWHERIARLDGIYLSHADSDHFNAIDGITKRFPTQKLITTQQILDHENPIMRSLLDSLRDRRIEFQAWTKGDEQEFHGVSYRAIHPPTGGVRGSDNANSLCVEIKYAGRSILLPGDLESPGTEMVIAESPLPVDVLMAPHHGSLTDKPGRILDWSLPKIVAISGGDRAKRNVVISKFDKEARTLLITARDGAIQVRVQRNGELELFRFKGRKWNLVQTIGSNAK